MRDPHTVVLTKGEQLVADLIVTGMPVKAIASRLVISHYTVNSHILKMCRKFNINGGKSELIAVLLLFNKVRADTTREFFKKKIELATGSRNASI